MSTASPGPGPTEVGPGYRYGGDDTAVQPAVGAAPVTPLVRERDEFGGMRFGSAFFGYVVASAMLVVLSTAVAAVLLAVNLDGGLTLQTLAAAQTAAASAAAGIVSLAIVLLAYLCGGYVAGRMARFSGLAQGFGVWLWAVLVTIVLIAAGVLLASQLGPDAGLPAVPLDGAAVAALDPQVLLAVGIVALVALVGALLGGLLGMPYHRRIDRANLPR